MYAAVVKNYALGSPVVPGSAERRVPLVARQAELGF
jgi:hypothetical protein